MATTTTHLNQLAQGQPITIKGCQLRATSIVNTTTVIIKCERHTQGLTSCVLYRRSRLRRAFDHALESLLTAPAVEVAAVNLALEQLANSPDPNSRLLAVHDPRSSINLLNHLKDDWWWEVRAGLATRPTCPLPLQRSLVQDENPWVRRALAENPNATAECIDLLAHDTDFGVRDAAAEHPQCSAATQLFLTSDERWEIRRSIAKRPDAPIEALTKLSDDPEPWVRLFVAANPATPRWLRTRLEHDTVTKVRSMARHADTQVAKITNALAFGLNQNPEADNS
jgi:hypothetical protein